MIYIHFSDVNFVYMNSTLQRRALHEEVDECKTERGLAESCNLAFVIVLMPIVVMVICK